MNKLEDVTVGSTVKGIVGDEPVNILAVNWYGSNVLDITYKDSRGIPGTQLLYRDSEPGLEVLSKHLPWSFDADAEQMKLASEAYRISLAHLFDPYLAVHTSAVEPLPHQISAVYQEMLPRVPLRYVLADDPGAGKTIMTGLYIKELMARGDLKRCLIVSPGSLAEQWQDELFSKFHLKFEILTNDRMESAVTGNIFTEVDRCICRLDKLARNDELQEKLKVSEWDLIVCDEAHKMSATVWGGEIKYTRRFQLGRLLSNITRNFLLLTATPHNGKEEDFQLFLSLVDPDRFEGTHHSSQQAVDVSDVMRRLVKEELLKFGGKIRKKETGRYQITSVPYAVRNRDMQIGYGEPVLKRYERVCFDKEYCVIPGQAQAELICPGHPLLEATIDLIREKNVDVMKRGAVFIDDSDFSEEARLLFYIEDAVQDGVTLKDGTRRTISKHVHFVEIKKDGSASGAGYAPYLDYRAAMDEEYKAVHDWMKSQDWLCKDVEGIAKGYAIQHLIPEHFAEVKNRKEAMLDKTAKAVKDRLTAEIQYWDYRAADLAQKEAAGKTNSRLNSKLAARRAEELESRMQSRLAEIEKERRISPMPPVITGGALVIPRGLLHKLTATSSGDTFGHGDRQSVEYAAMNAVIQIETSLGYRPTDVSAAKCGYDVESYIPEGMRKRVAAYTNALRFIEVKGRAKGSTTVTVSKNEILTALNKPDEFILAIVEVDGSDTHTIYLKQPFKNAPDFTATSVNYDIQDLIAESEVLYQK